MPVSERHLMEGFVRAPLQDRRARTGVRFLLSSMQTACQFIRNAGRKSKFVAHTQRNQGKSCFRFRN